jgi:serine/threonine-protein kinase
MEERQTPEYRLAAMNKATPSVDTILAQAVEIAAAERQAFVEQACGGDEGLRQRVERLVANHFQAGSFLERPAVAIDPGGTAGWQPPGSAGGVGSVIGAYKLLEQIGEGGMGLVFVAEQQQPLKRRVALKVIKPGMDSRQVIARFEAERQALALMDHAHIAQVHDGGTTAEGRPYFVMELVKGTPITAYCDQHRLTTRRRLELFLDVCSAVQHAHQKGIIHRDLKPSNVLVSHHDVAPVVKVIDFGIAKAIGGPLTDKTLYTALAQMVGTPLYMSPEQAGLSDLDVDTRSDVYSLGVLLYELLTGTTPFDGAALKEAGYDEMRRIIREDEPPRPSARLSTLEQARLSTIAERRGLEARRLSRQLRGELDWVVMKALEKDRDRRYESASAFAADVRRYLNDEPVAARPPSKIYLLRKFVRRHKAGLGVAACVLVVLVLGGVALWREQGQRAAAAAAVEGALERSEVLRQQERWQEALAVLAVAVGQLEGRGLAALGRRVEQSRRDVDMLLHLEEARLQLSAAGKEAAFDYAGADRLYAEAFQQYGLEVAALEAEEAARRVRASAIRERLTAALDDWADCRGKNPDRGGTEALRAVARLADDDPWRQRLREAAGRSDRAALEALAEQEHTLSKGPTGLVWLASSLRSAGNLALAERLLRQAQAAHPADFWVNFKLAYILTEEKGAAHGEAVRFYQAALALRPQSPVVHSNLGVALKDKGQMDEAIAEYRQAIRLNKDFPAAHLNLGNALRDKGQLDEAIAEHREAIRLNKDEPLAHCNLGFDLLHKGDLDGAIAECRQALRLKKDYPLAHYNLGVALRDKGQLDEAIAEYREALRLKKDYPDAHNNLGVALYDKRQVDEAIAEYRQALRLNKDDPNAHTNLGVALYDKGQLDEAIAEFRQALRLNKDDYKAHSNLGNALADKGQLDEAIAEFRQALRLNKDDPKVHYNLGIALRDKGELDQTIAEFREALRLQPGLVQARVELRHTEQLARLQSRLPALLQGKEQPKDAAERLALAGLCQRLDKQLHASAARWFAEAFAAQPSLTDDLDAGHRYNAACAAALAGCGQGKDVAGLDDTERGRLRRQALDWLGADLLAWRRSLDKEPDKAGPAVGQQLQHWLHDPDFNGVRGAAALAKLPQAERHSWQHLWADVADTLARSTAKAAPKKEPPTK